MKYQYEMDTLVPIVAKLAEGYTSKESTSITYDRAWQLMDAVLYCIHEAEITGCFSVVGQDEISPEKMYAIGLKYVKKKTKEALDMYNGIMPHFSSYGNQCLYDTVVKGLPEFFKWYDCKYEPQNTILTLDYPILEDISEHRGIDKIYDYISCIQLEQKFLNGFSRECVTGILEKYDKKYRLMIENICEIVLMNILSHMMAGKEISILNFEPDECYKMQAVIQMEDLETLREKLKNATSVFVREYYENDDKLREYLYNAVDNISVRMKNAADNGNLSNILLQSHLHTGLQISSIHFGKRNKQNTLYNQKSSLCIH